MGPGEHIRLTDLPVVGLFVLLAVATELAANFRGRAVRVLRALYLRTARGRAADAALRLGKGKGEPA